MHPKWLILAPPAVWSTIGLTALLAPAHLMNLFPVLWLLNDIGIFLGVAGVVATLFRGAAPLGPVLDEWSPAPQEPVARGAPLEQQLSRMAAALEREANELT